MGQQPKWDMYEAVLLLEAVLNVELGKENKQEAIKRISSILRRIAVKKGMLIDDIYRNINGISFQFKSMEYSMFGRVCPTQKTGSKLFDEVVSLYKNDTVEYNKILSTAHMLTNDCGDEESAIFDNTQKPSDHHAFMCWLLSEGKKEEAAKRIINSFEQISHYAKEKKLTSISLLDIKDIKEFNKAVNKIQSYKFFRILKKDLFKFLQLNSKLYVSYLKSDCPKNEFALSNDIPKEKYIVTKDDQTLFDKYGNKLVEAFLILKSNDTHVFLTISQICSVSSIDSVSAGEILEKASWAEKLGDGYILGQNNSIKQNAVLFSISEAFGEPSKVEAVLKENFRRGFRPNSIMDRNRFIALYESKYGIAVSEESIINEVQNSCFRFDDRFFLPKALISKDTAQEIAEYISKFFSQKDILFYHVLFGIFEEKFESYIYSSEMLAFLLKKILIGTQIYYSEMYCSLKAGAVPDISSEVIDFLIQMDGPCSYDVIYGQLSHLNQKDIYNVLHYNNPEIIGNSKVEYFHIKTAHLTDDELEELKEITISLLNSSKFITCNEIMDILEQNNHALMERLKNKFTVLGIRRIFTYYLRSNFDVDTGIVTNKGMKMTVIDAFADFAITRKHFTVDDVQIFSEYIGTVPYWETIHKYAVRINEKDFVSDDDVDFDVETIDDAIEHYCSDYITLNEISDYSRFPSCGVTWNIYLLQQYVFRYSKKFKLLSLGFTKCSVSGVIAKKQSIFDDFDSVVVDALKKTTITSPNDAIQFLCDKGYIGEKRYKRHTDLLKIAIAQRNNV